eukprot:3674748-Pyramimonas_sp.AAC.1
MASPCHLPRNRARASAPATPSIGPGTPRPLTGHNSTTEVQSNGSFGSDSSLLSPPSRNLEFRGCSKRNGPDRLWRCISKPSCENVSNETRQTTSRTFSESPEMRGCPRRNGLDHSAHSFKEPGRARMSHSRRARPPRAQHLGTLRCEDVSSAKRAEPPR